VTSGDRILDRTLDKIGGKGLFIKEIEIALAEGRADLAVHSLKDVPMAMPDGWTLAAVLERGDPRDALVSASGAALEALPPNARVGTSSLRRAMLLGRLRPDLEITFLRGNIDGRLAKLDRGDFDAVVLALAGLRRLGLESRVTEIFQTDRMLPAVGQGAIGIEIATDRTDIAQRLAPLVHVETTQCVTAERTVGHEMRASCSQPFAAHAWREDGWLTLRAISGEPGCATPVQGQASARLALTDLQGAVALGREVARQLHAAAISSAP